MDLHDLKGFWRKHGHRAVFTGVGLGASLLYMYQFTPHPKNKFLEEMSTYTNGKADFVDLELLNMSYELNKKFKWDKSMAKNSLGNDIKFFSYAGLDLCQHGYTQLVWDGHIGIPLFYSPKFNKKVEENPDLLMNKLNIDIRTDEGEKLYKLLQLSDDAKRFSLGHKMIQTRSSLPLRIFFTTVGVSYGCYIASVTLAAFIPIPGAVFACYAVLIPLSFFSVHHIIDFQNCWGDKRAIKRVAKLDEHYARGGLEYYESLIERGNLQEPELIKGVSFEKTPWYCDLILAFLDYFDFKNWFLKYRKPQLSNEERKKVVEDVFAMKYSKVKGKEEFMD